MLSKLYGPTHELVLRMRMCTLCYAAARLLSWEWRYGIAD